MRIRKKNCDYCRTIAAVRYRIQYDASEAWRLVCPDCQCKLAPDNPHYRYGGTWKAKKRK